MVWSTGSRDDSNAIAHRMIDDAHHRPMSPVCGHTTHGLWLRAWTSGERVPEGRRCEGCRGAAGVTADAYGGPESVNSRGI